MPDGTRSRTGCITCRIRKKKCDEQRPACQACSSRQLTCYGYNEPAPPWYLSKANWKEVQESEEAKALKALAETRYRIRRKIGLNTVGLAGTDAPRNRSVGLSVRSLNGLTTSTIDKQQILAPNTWQLRPESLWWDSKIRSLRSEPGLASNEETRLLMLYVDVIHPITHQFIPIESSKDRRWLLNRLISNQPLYKSALSVSACFEHSLSQPPRVDEIGISPFVRRLQSAAVRDLKSSIEKYVATGDMPLDVFICGGIKLLDAVFGLLNLELFSMLQGSWEMHFKAARVLLNHITTCLPISVPATHNEGNPICSLNTAFERWSSDEERRQTLEFCILNYIWVDVIACSIFGSYSYAPYAFDYVAAIKSGYVKTEDIMGCYGPVVVQIIEIIRLEHWKHDQVLAGKGEDTKAELHSRGEVINAEITLEISELEQAANQLDTTDDNNREEDKRLLTLLFATAAQILLQFILRDSTSHTSIDQTWVDICLQKLEALPTRLVIRSTWAYTISGSMSVSESQHERFRSIVTRTMQDSQPPGMSWKGLMVMEECWRLREVTGDPRIGWREAMESMNARVLLL